jgi:hypothetical protein
VQLLLQELFGNQTFQFTADPAGEWYMTLAVDPQSQPLFYLNLSTAEVSPIIESMRRTPVRTYRHVLEQRRLLLEACRQARKFLAGQTDRASLETFLALAVACAEVPIGAAGPGEKETDICLECRNPTPC